MCPVRLFSERAKSKRFMSRRPVIPRDSGCGKMGTAVVSGPNAQKAVVSGPKAQKLLQAAQDLFDGLQSTWSHHMVSRQPLKNFHGLQNAKKVRMGRNVPKRWSPLDLSGVKLPNNF